MKSNPFPYKEVEGAAPMTKHALDQRMTRLANERGALFEKAGTSAGLAANDHERLKSIERELDECFLVRRRMRATDDARRFENETRIPRVLARPQRES
jgi:hypothetical protein